MKLLSSRLSQKVGLDLDYFLPSGLWVGARYTILGILSLGISIAFARLGTAELYGQYQFSLALVSFLSVLTIPGLNTVALIAVAKGIPKVLLSATRICFQAGWLVSVLVALIGIYYLTIKDQPAVGWSLVGASALLPFFYGPNGWYTYYEGKRDFQSTTKRILLTNGLVALLLLWGLWQDWSLPILVIGYFFVNAALTTFYYQEIRKKISSDPPVNADVKAGVLYTLQKSSYTLPDTIQPLLISSLFGFGTLGIFMIAYALVNSANGLIGALSATYFPLLLKYKKLVHGRIVLQNLGLGLLLAIAYFSFVTVLFIPLYGTRFIDSFQLAQYFSGVVVLMPLKLYFSSYFTAQNAPGLLIRTNLASYAIAVAVFLLVGTTSVIASFVSYYAALQLATVIILGIAYYRRVRAESRIVLRKTRE